MTSPVARVRGRLCRGLLAGLLLTWPTSVLAQPGTNAIAVADVASVDWVHKRTRLCFFGGPGGLAEKFKQAEEYGADMVEMLVFERTSKGAWHHSKLQPRDPELGEQDSIRDYVAGAHQRGMKALGVVQMPWNPWFLKAHPECFIRDTNDEKYRSYPPSERQGCFNSRFGQHMIDLVCEIAREYPIDGFTSDGFAASPICYCDACAELYRKETNASLPARVSIQDPEYRRYLPWRDQKFNEFTLRLQQALKGVRKDLAFGAWFWGKTRWQDNEVRRCSASLNLLLDLPMSEMFWDWGGDQGNTLVANFAYKWQTGAGRGRPTLYMPAHKGHGHERLHLPIVERDFRIYSALTGISASGALGMIHFADGYMSGALADVRQTFRLAREREPWLTNTRPVKYAALIYSEATDTFYATRDQPVSQYRPWGITKPPYPENTHRYLDRYLHHCYGAFRALTEEHLPVDVLQEWDVEQGLIDQYQVVVLPNTVVLSPAAQERLRRYVERGGGLVATYLTSLGDADGKLQTNFGLADLLQVSSFRGTENRTLAFADTRKPESSPDKLVFTNHPVVDDAVVRASLRTDPGEQLGLVSYVGKVAYVEAKPGVQLIMTRTAGGAEAKQPAGWSTEFGRGRVVYFPAAIDHAYFTVPVPYERRLLANAVRFVAGAVPEVEIRAPMSVYAAINFQPAQRRYVVHLLNESNSTANRALPSGDAPFREEILPVAGIELHFRNRAVKSVSVQPENRSLPLVSTDSGVSVRLPELGLHALVVAELSE